MKTSQRGNNAQKAACVFISHPERIASAWRYNRRHIFRDSLFHSALDSLLDNFIKEIGHFLNNMPGSPWARCQGVLRLCKPHGASLLCEEFSALRRCLDDALEALQAPSHLQHGMNDAIDEALSSALTHLEVLRCLKPFPVDVPFGGLVVEVFHPLSQEEDPSRKATQPNVPLPMNAPLPHQF